MITTLDDTRVEYNDIQLATLFTKYFIANGADDTLNYGLIAARVDSEPVIPFAASHSLSTTKAMYRQQDIITAIDGQVLTFELTLIPVKISSALDVLEQIPWNNEMWSILYQALDTREYKPLKLGDAQGHQFVNPDGSEITGEQGVGWVSRPYYNCIPCIDSLSELKMFEDSSGYVTIPFVCDAPHMWIDVNKAYHREAEGGMATGWILPNYGNVRNYSGQAMVYPIIEIFGLEYDSSAEESLGYISFQAAKEIDGQDVKTAEAWFRLIGFPVQPNMRLIIDCYNKQIYGFDEEGNLLDVNYLQYLHPLRFFELPEEEINKGELLPVTGDEALEKIGKAHPITDFDTTKGIPVYHRTLIADNTTSRYTIRFNYSCPYMGGNEDNTPYPFNPSDIDNHSVMLHTNDENSN